ncbi:hypothetical protein ACWD01_10100 [Streptomyces sp. NPDC002835]
MKAGKKGSSAKQLIAVAGEGRYDREILRHLIPVVHAIPAARRPKMAQITRDMRLNKADNQLAPRLQVLKQLAQGLAAKEQATLLGIVVHVDLDHVIDDNYTERRKRLAADLERTFDCETALALAADEIEAWLMLFPDAFPKVKPGWKLKDRDRQRDLGRILGTKEHLKTHLGHPMYRESDAPLVMKAAVDHNLVNSCQAKRNQSYADFIEDLKRWPGKTR